MCENLFKKLQVSGHRPYPKRDFDKAFSCEFCKIVQNIFFADTNLEEKIFRSSRLEVFCKKGVLRYFTKFTRKHLCQRLFFNKVASLLRTLSLTEHVRWQFLKYCQLPKQPFADLFKVDAIKNFQKSQKNKCAGACILKQLVA